MNNNHGVIIEETLQDSFIVFFIESCLRYTNDTAFVQQLIVSLLFRVIFLWNFHHFCQIWPVKNIILCLINFSMSYENVDTVFCSLIFFVPLINFHCSYLLISSKLIHILHLKYFILFLSKCKIIFT